MGTPAAEALQIADEALRALELGELPLVSVAMRAGRIARLLGESDYERIFQWEVGGYPTTPKGLAPDTWRLAGMANRHYPNTSQTNQEPVTLAYLEAIEVIESAVSTAAQRLAFLNATPASKQGFAEPLERVGLTQSLERSVKRLAARRSLLYDYLSSRFHQLRYSNITADAFSRLRLRVDARLAAKVPIAVQQFDSVYANLQSSNAEDWSNALHSCRRILENLADALFSPTDAVRVKGNKTITLGPANYKNRLICYAEDHSESRTFQAVVGSHLSFLIDRLDALFDATNKGTHTTVAHADADRYVIYTYVVIGDLLSLGESSNESS